MNINVERINISNAVIKCLVDEKEFSSKIDEIAKKDLKNVKIDGFRPGKTPLKMLKQKFSKELQESTEQSFMQEIYQDGLKKIGITQEDVLGEPIFDKYDKENNKLDVEMKISLKPIFKIIDYNECIPDIKKQNVTKAEVADRIKKIANSYIQPEDVKDRDIAQDKDFVNIDFKGFIDDKVFEGGEAKNYILEIGSKSFIDNFEEQIIGMKIGEEKDIQVSFPKNYQKEELSGKKVTFKVKLNSIQIKPEPKLDDELAKKIIPPKNSKEKDKQSDITFKTLEDDVKARMIEEKKSEYYATLKEKFFDTLLDKFEDFALPENIVEQEIVAMTRQKINAMNDDQIKDLKENSKKIDEIRDASKGESNKRVRLTFIVDAIAKKEDISITDQQLMQEIYIEAMQTNQDPKEMYEIYKKNNILAALKMALVEERLTTKLFDKKLNSTPAKTKPATK